MSHSSTPVGPTEAGGQVPPPRADRGARDLLDRARRELHDGILRGPSGRPAAERFTGRLDELVRTLYAEAPSPPQRVAVLAIGGYGRRRMAPWSDVDLLVLFETDPGPADEAFLRAMLHPLWDAGLVVGHQVRALHEFAVLERDNPEFLLAVVDARLVAGDGDLADRLSAAVHRWPTHAFLLGALQDLIETRYVPFNGTPYQLEPDLKDGPGGLRDLDAIRTIARITAPALLADGPTEMARLEEAEDFLLRLRAIVHAEAGRNQNVLTHELQEAAAQRLGYPGAQVRAQVERLMGEYFRHARAVNRMLAWTHRTAPVPVGTNLVRTADGIAFADPRRAMAHPDTWVDAFTAAVDQGTRVADATIAWLQQHVGAHTADAFVPDAPAREALLAFLRPRPGLYDRLTEMHDCGLLGRIFPEFQTVGSRVVRDFYHKYTVDEHTLLAIRLLEDLPRVTTGSRARFAALLDALAAPELLVLALLFHDVGKWVEEDHAAESVRMARGMLERLRMPSEAAALVECLVREHLRMSVAAFRRDGDDPGVARDLAAAAGTEQRLQALCLLTLADVGAVGPGTLSPWREELLWRLYVDAYRALTVGYADDLIDPDLTAAVEVAANRPGDLSAADVDALLEGFPRRYLQLFDRDAIYQHARWLRDLGDAEVHVAIQRRETSWEVSVATRDQPYLFSNVCGVLSSYGMDILRGQALTHPRGLALDVFQFIDGDRFLTMNPGAAGVVAGDLRAAAVGQLDVAARLRAREHGAGRRRVALPVPAIVRADADASPHYTVVEVVATNGLGLLHRTSRVMSRHGCDVHLVLIATEGETAVDVFHITRAGVKLTDAEQQTLSAALARMLEAGDETD